jgi:hypothetical protein
MLTAVMEHWRREEAVLGKMMETETLTNDF